MKTEQYLKEHKNSGLKVGDKVKVVMKCPSHARGWDSFWREKMDSTIGKVGIIMGNFNESGFNIKFGFDDADDGSWNYPYFVLEKVESDDKFDYTRFGCHADAVKDLVEYLKKEFGKKE